MAANSPAAQQASSMLASECARKTIGARESSQASSDRRCSLSARALSSPRSTENPSRQQCAAAVVRKGSTASSPLFGWPQAWHAALLPLSHLEQTSNGQRSTPCPWPGPTATRDFW
ncbi:hypothetical protein M3J09_001151 [Ascochyta lentis]